jgi:hypothetical protein
VQDTAEQSIRLLLELAESKLNPHWWNVVIASLGPNDRLSLRTVPKPPAYGCQAGIGRPCILAIEEIE